MMKYFLFLFTNILFLVCGCKLQTAVCPVINAADIDKDQELIFENGKLRQINKAVHDTVAIDLFIVITDQHGKKIEGALAEIISIASAKTNIYGQASFIAFSNQAGTFKIKISHKDYGCIEIDQLKFESGIIRWLEITFIK